MGFSARLVAGLAAAAGFVQLASADDLVDRTDSGGCHSNNCLRAIIASAVTTRHGVADCNSYLLTTVMLPTKTITDYTKSTYYVTLPSLITETDYTVTTSTSTKTKVKSTTTTTPTTTTKVIATKIDKTTTKTTSSKTKTKTETKTVNKGHPYGRRDGYLPTTTTIVPTKIPDYASACTPVSVAYTSACLCAGATASITTITPLTTVTETKKVYETVYTPETKTVTMTKTKGDVKETVKVVTRTKTSTKVVPTVATVTKIATSVITKTKTETKTVTMTKW
ncbi:MAG: hypothetical protein STHCBS139747_004392 [Sporothrix thermara]